MDRRALGKNLQEIKKKQENDEMKRLAEERLKDKAEEQLARERIKEQIAEDRARKAVQFEEHKAAELAHRQERERKALQEKARILERQAADARYLSPLSGPSALDMSSALHYCLLAANHICMRCRRPAI